MKAAVMYQKGELPQYVDVDEYTQKVESDIQKAEALGIRSVPFFVFDRKYAISGAQPPEHFKQVLDESFKERKQENL